MTVPDYVRLARHELDLDDDGHEYLENSVTVETDTTKVPHPDGAGGVVWGTDAGGGGVTGFATPAIVLGTAAAAGAATTVIRSDSTIAAFDATAPTTSAIGDSAATGSAAKAARRDHVHGREALSTATPLIESGAGAVGSGVKSSREDHVHPALGAATYALDDLTDVTIAGPAVADRLRFDGSVWRNSSLIWIPIMDGLGNVLTDSGTGQAIISEVSL